MNIRNFPIEIQCNHKDVSDVTQALIHSILFFRTHGKFNYKHEGSYSIGTLGYELAICDRIGFSYIRCSSPTLVNRVNNKIQEFVDTVNEFTQSAVVSIEFYTKRPSRWPFNDTKIVWEMWNIKFTFLQPPVSHQNNHLQVSSTPPNQQATFGSIFNGDANFPPQSSESFVKLEEILSQKLLDIVGIVNSEKCFLPSMPTQPNLDTVFDTSHSDLQPYLYSISCKVSEFSPVLHSALGSSVKFGEIGTISDTPQSSLKKFLLGTLEL